MDGSALKIQINHYPADSEWAPFLDRETVWTENCTRLKKTLFSIVFWPVRELAVERGLRPLDRFSGGSKSKKPAEYENGHVMRPLGVFLVENHEDTVRYIQLYLEHLGHEVTIARDMATALEHFPKSKYDVLISDISLPDGDGWKLLEQLKERRPSFAIAISGYGSKNDVNRSRSAGYNHHLVKPFLPDDLMALLNEAGECVGDPEKAPEQESKS